MTAGSDPQANSAPRGPLGTSSVASDLEAIFAEAAPAPSAPETAGKVRAVTGRRSRLPYATLGAVAAAGIVGLTAGAGFVGVRPKPGPVAATAAAPPAPVAQVLPAQVAAPTVTLPTAHSGPIPVLDNTPVTPARKARPRRARATGPVDLVTADRRLRAAYSHAVRAGVPRRVLVTYRDRWADLREDATWRPQRVAAGYGAMTADLERLARQPRARREPPRHTLFELFS